MHYCTVDFDGYEVKIYEPPRKEAFRLLGEAVILAEKMGVKPEGSAEPNIGLALTCVPGLFDFVFSVSKESKEKKKELEDTFTIQDLMSAYAKVVEMLSAPLSGSKDVSLPPPESKKE